MKKITVFQVEGFMTAQDLREFILHFDNYKFNQKDVIKMSIHFVQRSKTASEWVKKPTEWHVVLSCEKKLKKKFLEVLEKMGWTHNFDIKHGVFI